MGQNKNLLITTSEKNEDEILEKILNGKSIHKNQHLFISLNKELKILKSLICEKGLCEKGHYILKRFSEKNSKVDYFDKPYSLTQISLLISDHLLSDNPKIIIIHAPEELFSRYNIYSVERFYKFLFRTINEQKIGVTLICNLEKSKTLLPKIKSSFKDIINY